MDEFDQVLLEAFPAATDAAVVRNMTLAVGLADDLRNNTPWLGSLLGDDLAGSLRRIAAMYRFAQACKDGELPFSATEIPNSTGSCHLLQIESGSVEAHIVRTDGPRGFPKDAPIRQDRRLTNQPDMFDDVPKIVAIGDLMAQVGTAYAWLTFNATPTGMLTHVCWAMPMAEENAYLAHRNILLSAMVSGTAPTTTDPPKPSVADKIKFRDEVEKAADTAKKKKNDQG